MALAWYGVCTYRTELRIASSLHCCLFLRFIDRDQSGALNVEEIEDALNSLGIFVTREVGPRVQGPGRDGGCCRPRGFPARQGPFVRCCVADAV